MVGSARCADRTSQRNVPTRQEPAHKLAELERKIESHDAGIRTRFEAIHHLTTPPAKPRREIGFHVKEDGVSYRVKRK